MSESEIQAERLRVLGESHKDLAGQVRELTRKVQALETIRTVVIVLAGILGIGQGIGYRVLTAATDRMTTLTTQVASIETRIRESDSVVDKNADDMVEKARSKFLSQHSFAELFNSSGHLVVRDTVIAAEKSVDQYQAQIESRLPTGWVLAGGGAQGSSNRMLFASRPTQDRRGWYGWSQDFGGPGVRGTVTTYVVGLKVEYLPANRIPPPARR